MTNAPSRISIEEAARALDIDRNTYRRGIVEKTLPGVIVGRRIIIPRAAFEAFMSGTRETKPEPTVAPLELADMVIARLIERFAATAQSIERRR